MQSISVFCRAIHRTRKVDVSVRVCECTHTCNMYEYTYKITVLNLKLKNKTEKITQVLGKTIHSHHTQRHTFDLLNCLVAVPDGRGEGRLVINQAQASRRTGATQQLTGLLSGQKVKTHIRGALYRSRGAAAGSQLLDVGTVGVGLMCSPQATGGPGAVRPWRTSGRPAFLASAQDSPPSSGELATLQDNA